jgi:hypothetical protein
MRTLILVGLGFCGAFAAAAEPLERHTAGATGALSSVSEPEDACGGRGLLDTVVPDGPFTQACKLHDACFRSNAMDQGRCDRDFLKDMRDACDAKYPAASGAAQHGVCEAAAWTYFRAVNSRFGAHEYSYGTNGGAIQSTWQQVTRDRDGSDELTACARIANTSNRVQHYSLVLSPATGGRAAVAPRLGTKVLQPGDAAQLCASTDFLPGVTLASMGKTYALTLEADDPDQFGLNDQLRIDQRLCDVETGDCRAG